MSDIEVIAAIRKVGGIVHSDGNVFFTNVALFMAAAELVNPRTLRDHFAANAMQALIQRVPFGGFAEISKIEITSSAYAMADSMLKAREGE